MTKKEQKTRVNVLITGSSRGIGRAAAIKFLSEGCSVTGLDVLPSSIDDPSYTHFIADVSDPTTLPPLLERGTGARSARSCADPIHESTPPERAPVPRSASEFVIAPDVIFINAGVQNSADDIATNLRGAINVTEKYAFQSAIRSVLFNASASARSGFEFPEYAASKAGLVGYMKNVAARLAPFGATANAISPGGVLTDSNKPVTDDPLLWQKIMAVTPLKKWATEQELAEWIWFLTMVNKSASGVDILIDNGESNLNSTFVWPE